MISLRSGIGARIKTSAGGYRHIFVETKIGSEFENVMYRIDHLNIDKSYLFMAKLIFPLHDYFHPTPKKSNVVLMHGMVIDTTRDLHDSPFQEVRLNSVMAAEIFEDLMAMVHGASRTLYEYEKLKYCALIKETR